MLFIGVIFLEYIADEIDQLDIQLAQSLWQRVVFLAFVRFYRGIMMILRDLLTPLCPHNGNGSIGRRILLGIPMLR